MGVKTSIRPMIMTTKYNENYGALSLPFLVLCASQGSQAENEDVIARCAKIPSVGDRILCLEGALRESARGQGPALASDASPEEGLAPGPGASDAAASAVDSVDIGSEDTGATSRSAPADAKSGPQSNEAPAAKSTEAEQFGLSEPQTIPDTPVSVAVVVAAMDRDAYGKLIFTTESGQVWRQTDQGRPRYPAIPFDAEIRKGAAGSFFIEPSSGGIAIRVKRSK